MVYNKYSCQCYRQVAEQRQISWEEEKLKNYIRCVQVKEKHSKNRSCGKQIFSCGK